MAESVSSRIVEQSIDKTSSTEGPNAGEVFTNIPLYPAFGSFDDSVERVDQRPSTQSERSNSKMKRTKIVTVKLLGVRSELATTDALTENCILGGNGTLFSLDRLFHRRS